MNPGKNYNPGNPEEYARDLLSLSNSELEGETQDAKIRAECKETAWMLPLCLRAATVRIAVAREDAIKASLGTADPTLMDATVTGDGFYALTALDIRKMGFGVPKGVPDNAVVARADDFRVTFHIPTKGGEVGEGLEKGVEEVIKP